jgi:oxygen-independent coproporphyrinogen-3 oxidase
VDRKEDYQSLLGQGVLPLRRARRLTPEERLIRELILQLKWGSIEFGPFQEKFGVDVLMRFTGVLKKLGEEGWLETSPAGIRLTRAGLIRVDALLPRFFLPEHRGIRYT